MKAWDQFTMQREPISSIMLMERAAQQCVSWITKKWNNTNTHFIIFCGSGNNGGDGLAIGRLLLTNAYHVTIILIESDQRSEDNIHNLNKIRSLYPSCIVNAHDEFQIAKDAIIIDAIFGTGLNRKADGIELQMINKINVCPNIVLSIDIPSGLPADCSTEIGDCIQANYTLTFQQFKLSFLYPETGLCCGEIVVLDIQLHPKFLESQSSSLFILSKSDIQSHYKKRMPFSHKGSYGHALIVAGSHHKMGACILASKSCLRSGAGLVTVYIPEIENSILQMAVPEAMTETYSNNEIDFHLKIDQFNSIGIGCGLGTGAQSTNLLTYLIKNVNHPILLDADALNIIAANKHLLHDIPKHSILTPHPKEFDRLFGSCETSYERNKLQIEMSIQYNLYIVLKGRFTSISTPKGLTYFNIIGNPGMATGGSGDVLSGIITGLYAQYQDMELAALMGVYLHALSGDISSSLQTEESLIASDLIQNLGQSFRQTFYDIEE
ncbi:MAG TPA: NAD(P)H-hydrate dehydratase [Chitinophagaceae bacterium]|nr:NAD(P)H-hydrate dehydratase [Chitinophagaceae bacterium]